MTDNISDGLPSKTFPVLYVDRALLRQLILDMGRATSDPVEWEKNRTIVLSWPSAMAVIALVMMPSTEATKETGGNDWGWIPWPSHDDSAGPMNEQSNESTPQSGSND